MRAIVEYLFSPGDSAFLCHSTAERDSDGHLTADRAVPCAGAVMFREKCAEASSLLRLIVRRARPNGYDPMRLRGWERIKSMLAELFAAALPDDAEEHAAYLRPLDGGALEPFDEAERGNGLEL